MNTQPVLNPNPKARFQQSADNVSKHKKLVDMPEFQRAADFALLQYQALLSPSQANMNDAAFNGVRIQGAIEFLKIFRELGDTPAPVPPTARLDNLNHSLS